LRIVAAIAFAAILALLVHLSGGLRGASDTVASGSASAGAASGASFATGDISRGASIGPLGAGGVATGTAVSGGGFPGGPVEEALDSALCQADAGIVTDADALEAARLLEKAIRTNPARARDATILLGKLKSRSLAFRAALIVGRAQQDPLVRAALLENARRGAGHAREVVAYSFYGKEGDAEVAQVMAEGFLDESAPATVRASHAFAAASMLKELTPATRDAVRAKAREALSSDKDALEVRVEALDLLDVKGVDRQRARELLQGTPERKIALSAARVLLRAGEDEKYVKGELMRFTSSDDVVSKSLKEILEEGRPGM